jgi:hypothetical protein
MKAARRLVVMIVAASALLAVAASPSFAWSEALFSDTAHGIKWSGSLTIYKNGGTAKTCTFPGGQNGLISASGFMLNNNPPGPIALSCTGSTTLVWQPAGDAAYESGYRLEAWDNASFSGYHASPYGQWAGDDFIVPFTNAAGGTPSTVTFSSTVIGHTSTLATVTATGTVNVTTNSGGALTLSH